ncbi:hypothetical protein A7K91_00530 [Paenibacillus oryzae]|uniref:LamG-like jellyroll fold domain-containing protein n=1 Tax=Paenibacillus oryzae TaxID=1844972 RepID=A0A1A5YHY2_9BACL|nr:LamG domain-containing protein [Paenibacillus oryzae]OBR65197.1 hypothetical protein A7K91_00530 [Paenibacillus oryzae]
MKVLTNGLVAEYLFDGNALDTSGNGNHGRVEGATPTVNRFNEPDRALAFSGNGEFVVLDPKLFQNATAFSLSIWVNYDEAAKMKWWNNAIISQDDNGRQSDKSQRVFQLSTMNNSVRVHMMMNAPDVTAQHPVQRGQWYHLAVTYNGSHYALYMNGKLQGIQEYTFRPSTEEPIYIGKKNSEEPRFYFHGAIDDLRIFSRALSEPEILELYTEQGYVPAVELAPPVQHKSSSSTKRKVLEKPI